MGGYVAGAAIIRDGRLLAAQRGHPPELDGFWELPGGKVEPGETGVDALVRECREELGVLIRIGDSVGKNWPLSDGWMMRVWIAHLVAGEPEPREHRALRWVCAAELCTVRWLTVDRPIVDEVRPYLST